MKETKNTSRADISEGVFWDNLRKEAEDSKRHEPEMADYFETMILGHDSLEKALAHFLGHKLGMLNGAAKSIETLCLKAFSTDKEIVKNAVRDMQASRDRDPACCTWLQPFLFFKGPAALHTYRVAHWFWNNRKRMLAYYLQSLCSQVFQVDIHPAARIGSGVFIDHATGVVIGETSVVGDDVSILHGVTLGGSGKEHGDRHPKIGRGVLLAAGATVLGNIKVGDHARVAACSVVLDDVAPHVTVAGIPAKPVRVQTPEHPAEAMEHRLKT